MSLKRLAIVALHRNAPSETFIRAHVSGLPADVHFLTGEPLPSEASTGLSGKVQPLRAEGPACLNDLVRYLQTQGIEAVLAEYGPVGVAIAPACREADVPLIVHFHGYDTYRHDVLAQYGSFYPGLFRSASAIVAASEPMARDLVRMGASEGLVHSIPCGYDALTFRRESAAGKRPLVFLAVGRLVEKKGPMHTIRAFEVVRRRIPGAKLVFVGDGPLLDGCHALVKQLHLEECVEFAGTLDPIDVARRMSLARVFVQHSITPSSGDREGTPVSLLEAAGAGLPIVSTRHGGIPGVVVEGVTGFLVDEGDVGAMAERMFELARDTALATRLGEAGHQRATARFTNEIRIGELWNIIRKTFRMEEEEGVA